MADVKTAVTDIRIKELINERKWIALREEVKDIPAPDLADFILSLDKADRILVFRLLPRDQASEVFASLEPSYRDDLLMALSDEETRVLLADLKPDDRTDLLEELPGQVVQRMLNLLKPEDLREAIGLLGYPEESVGRLMTPDYVAVRSFWTIEKALEHIRTKGKESETINVIYVTDARWKLLDALELRKFILADPEDHVEDIMDYSYVSILVTEDREKAVQLIKRYDLEALPVVDSEGILLGIVTVDDVMDVAEEEATEDFHKTAAVAPLRLSYPETGVVGLFKRRIGWLLFLVFLNLVSSGVIAAFEKALSKAIVLAFFLPLLADSGGNVGSQSATIIIRALAVGEISTKDWLKALLKELGVGLLLGATMGLASWVLGFIRGDWRVGIVVGFSMILIVIIANLIGLVLPMLLTKLKLDPATASSPLLTTIIDSAGLLIYFTMAGLILHLY